MRIELLFVEGCANVTQARKLLMEVLRDEKIADPIEEIVVDSDVTAKRLGFPGTPTIRIDGVDVEKAARVKDAVSLKPRMYIRAGMITGCPTRAAILDAILDAKANANRS